ncbi:MAG TPA: hypothetical protein VJJ52_01880 [Candidatus Nanoarchaeia archaeon]|nr:hypothetical protein [Candidatus Nanoarchaeia archaeon]
MTNYVGDLFNIIRSQGLQPSSIIPQVVDEARIKGYITDKMYDILQHTMPFPGLERQTIQSVARKNGIKISEAVRLQPEAYSNLARYITRTSTNGEARLEVLLGDIEWEECAASARAINALTNHFTKYLNFPRPPTAKEVLEWMNKMAQTGKKVDIRSYGALSHRTAQETFNALGVTLPDYDNVKKRFLPNRGIISDIGSLTNAEVNTTDAPYEIIEKKMDYPIVIQKDGKLYLSIAEAKRRTQLTGTRFVRSLKKYAGAVPSADFYHVGKNRSTFVPLEMVGKIPTYMEDSNGGHGEF